MPLVTCPDCGQEVSDHAEACPHCGYPIVDSQPESVTAAPTLRPPDHGLYRCVTGAKIPKYQQIDGQRCPFCGRKLRATPTGSGDRTTRRSLKPWQITAIIFGGSLLLFLVAQSDLFDEFGTDSGRTSAGSNQSGSNSSSDQISISRTFEGGGERSTEAFRLSGDYVVTVTTGSDCFYGIDLDDADDGFTEESLATRSEPGTTTTNLFAIPRGRYFIDVITGPSPDCPWTVRIVG